MPRRPCQKCRVLVHKSPGCRDEWQGFGLQPFSFNHGQRGTAVGSHVARGFRPTLLFRVGLWFCLCGICGRVPPHCCSGEGRWRRPGGEVDGETNKSGATPCKRNTGLERNSKHAHVLTDSDSPSYRMDLGGAEFRSMNSLAEIGELRKREGWEGHMVTHI